MTSTFNSPIGNELAAFLGFKRARGYRYGRAEFFLRSFDRFVASRMQLRRPRRLDEAMLAWLGRLPGRKPNSVSMELAVLREFWRYLRRLDPRRFAHEPLWPRLPTAAPFAATVLSPAQVRLMLRLIGRLDRPRFRRYLYRALFLVQYCTGLRFGEALRLRIRDVDLRRRTLFVAEFKGRSRWVPFHPSLATELNRYLRARRSFVGADPRPDDRLFVGANLRRLPVETAGGTLRKLYRVSGLKPAHGRIGPRPYDLRHTFVVHRLTRWYRQGVDLHSRLPWLSAYLGHVNLLGTETYLAATPELLSLAADRFRRHYTGRKRRP
jgi:integrase